MINYAFTVLIAVYNGKTVQYIVNTLRMSVVLPVPFHTRREFLVATRIRPKPGKIEPVPTLSCIHKVKTLYQLGAN